MATMGVPALNRILDFGQLVAEKSRVCHSEERSGVLRSNDESSVWFASSPTADPSLLHSMGRA
jgi:hypothetical protein